MLGVLFLTIVALSAPVPAGAACSVGNSLERLVDAYQLIFEADVTEVQGEIKMPVTRPDGEVSTWRGILVRMQIRQVWKGEPDRTVDIVYTHHAQNIHGRFHKGDRFIVWASQRDGRWLTSDCAPTVESGRASVGMRAFLERLKKHARPSRLLM